MNWLSHVLVTGDRVGVVTLDFYEKFNFVTLIRLINELRALKKLKDKQ